MDARTTALKTADALGAAFGTEDFSLFLYSLVRLQHPRTMVELGTGYGVSAFLMGLAAKENGVGHLWTIDDGALLRDKNVLEKAVGALREAGLDFNATTPKAYWDGITSTLGITSTVTQVERRMDLNELGHFESYPFASTPIDLVFADFGGGSADQTLRILGHFLPLTSDVSSIFIDSLPSVWPSYLMLERTVELLNAGKVPAVLQSLCKTDLTPLVTRRRFTLVHITKPAKLLQSGTAWLKMEPVDLFPHPRTPMFGAQTLQRYGVDMEAMAREAKPAGRDGLASTGGSASPSRDPMSGAVMAATHAFQLANAVREWVGSVHPGLEDRTPAQAVKTPEGAAKVKELLGELRNEYPREIADVLIGRISEALGLDGRGN